MWLSTSGETWKWMKRSTSSQCHWCFNSSNQGVHKGRGIGGLTGCEDGFAPCFNLTIYRKVFVIKKFSLKQLSYQWTPVVLMLQTFNEILTYLSDHTRWNMVSFFQFIYRGILLEVTYTNLKFDRLRYWMKFLVMVRQQQKFVPGLDFRTENRPAIGLLH